MTLNNTDINKLKELEESLWREETRFDKNYMDKILAPGFFEYGRSGRVYNREETLSAPTQKINAKLPLQNFSVHSIDTNAVLVTYISEVKYDEIELGNRSSIWVKASDEWQLRFHQGTPVNKSI